MRILDSTSQSPNIARLFAGLKNQPTTELLLDELDGLASHWASGDCGRVHHENITTISALSLAVATAAYGDEHPRVATALADLAFNLAMWSSLEGVDRWKECVDAYEQALALVDKLGGALEQRRSWWEGQLRKARQRQL